MSLHRLPDRPVPRMPPFTTLAELEALHKATQERVGFFAKAMTQEKWHEHLAVVLRPNFGGDEK